MGIAMKRWLFAGLLAALTTTAWMPHTVLAASPTSADEFTARLMGRPPGNGETVVCFSRVYDDAHLAAHPKQNVRSMVLKVSVGHDDPGKYGLTIGVVFRHSKRPFETSGDCLNPEAQPDANGAFGVHCAVSCDGGSIGVALKDNGSVLVSIPDGARVWSPNANSDETQHGAFGEDDKIFRLDRADPRQCLSIADDASEKKLLLRGN
jgi:hypothetical protein